MRGFLSKNKIEYVLFHLNLVANIGSIKEKIVFVQSKEDINNFSGKIIFLLSDSELPKIENIIFYNDIPILFCNNSQNITTTINNNLVFNFDLLKSAFYLLSGYQEIVIKKRDFYGRFPYSESIQKKLDIVTKPVVNYYFDFIIDETNNFYKKEVIKRKKLFNNFGLLLTHDIDNIKYYTFENFLYKIKELLGLSKTTLSKKDITRYIFKYLMFSKENPYWNFDKLITLEQKYGFKSSFYFLKKEGRQNSRYNFSDKIIKKAFLLIKENEFEIGLHGTVSSATDSMILRKQKDELERISGENIVGGRQHRLVYNTPQTAINQEDVGLKYDSSLYFAEHEGFRNSFCLPFKLYDFDSDRAINIWEFPLTVMDVTLSHYRKYTSAQALENIINLIEEIKRHSGLFTLLWHNGFEMNYPKGQYNNLYADILEILKNNNPDLSLPKKIVEIIDI